MKDQTEIRDPKGRFAPGSRANPAGRPKLTVEQKIERSVATHGPDMLERAFIEAKTDSAVLAGLLNFLAASQGAANLNVAALLQSGAGIQH